MNIEVDTDTPTNELSNVVDNDVNDGKAEEKTLEEL